MKPISIIRKICGALQFAAFLLPGYSLTACAATDAPPPESPAPREARAPLTQTVHAVIYFQEPTTDNKFLSAAISGACRCQPVFLRPYGGDGLIYSVTLQQGQDFNAFEKALMLNAPQLGITTVEQDRLMQAD